MKIEATTTGGGDVVPPMIGTLIERITSASTTAQFVEELNKARTLQTILAKTELFRWTNVLNRCDDLLEEATQVKDNVMKIDACHQTKSTTISVLRFTSLLFECSSTRRIYASTDRLLALLEASDLDVIAEVLRLLQTISKRSKFLTQRLGPQEQASLVRRLTSIAEFWGGRLRNVKMTECIKSKLKLPMLFPFIYADGKGSLIKIEKTPKPTEPLLSIVAQHCGDLDAEHRYSVLARVRMLRNFQNPEHRLQCIIVRLLSISTLIHCRCQTDESQINSLLYPGFNEETVALLRMDRDQHPLVDPIQTEALRLLTSVVSLEKAFMLNDILGSLGASSYHGFLASFTRLVVDHLKKNELGTRGKPSVALGTALFSFIYHLSSVDPGGESLVACGLTQTLLSVLEYKELALEQISFATRCSRIIDIFTSIDVSAFNNCQGMTIFIDRLVHEVNECRKEQPFVIDTSGDVDDDSFKNVLVKTPIVDRRCHQQRSGLIKGLLTFIKRAIQENHLQEATRHIMEGGLPDALMHIISNAEFYSDSIYHHALQLVTNFIYQEPTQLTNLQAKHVPYVMLQSMLRKELPNSRDVISHLGNVFTALCLNEQGIRQFKSYRPFDHVFKIVLSLKFIATMKKKRSEMSDAAQGVGSAMDDLLRHQPTLKPLMLDSVITALDMLLNLGQNPPSNTKIVMALSRSASKAACQNICSGSGGNSPRAEREGAAAAGNEDEEEALGMFSPPREDEMSDEDDEEAELSMDEMSAVRQPTVDKMGLEMDCPSEDNDGTRVLPLGDYLLIFAKIFETVITQANASDMVDGFVEKDGMEKLLLLSQLPSLSTDLAASNFGQRVASIIQCLLQNNSAGTRLMSSFVDILDQRAGNMLQAVPEAGGSCLVHLGKKNISDCLAFINMAVPILAHLSKAVLSGGQYATDRRSRIHEAWLTVTGKLLHSKLRRISRHLSWESTLIKLIEPTKVVASTQTDTVTDFASMVQEEQMQHTETERTSPPNMVASVAVDPKESPKPTWEESSISEHEVQFWRENKPLADMLVKANKSTSEFLSLLSRSCYVPVRRNRRYDFASTPMPRSAAQMADQVFAAIYRELKWRSPKAPDSTMEFGRLNEVLTQLTGVLFDERNFPYHAMVQRFYTSGCHQVFCDLLNEKLSVALDKPPTQPLEMVLTTWFRLAEKLSMKQKMVHSIYRQTPLQSLNFNPETYLKLVHSDFFRCLSVLFSRLSADGVDLRNYQSLCEAAISVYKEVAQSLVPSDGPPTPEQANARGRGAAAGPAAVNEAQIQELLDLDLGFGREEIVQALNDFPTANEATEWLMDREHVRQMQVDPFAELARRAALRDNNGEDETAAAGGNEVPAAVRGAAGVDGGEVAVQGEEDHIDTPIIKPLSELSIDKDVSISQACIELMPLCKRLMEVGSELVFSCADMVIGVVDSLDDTWKKSQLISKIMIEEIIEMAQSVNAKPEEELATVLSTRIHFVCLLFEHIASDYLEMLCDHDIVNVMLSLLRTVHEHFELSYMHNTLLPPVVLWLDLYGKCQRALKRRNLLEKMVPSKQLKWSYHGDDNEARYNGPRSVFPAKKWIAYQPTVQTAINQAFFQGKTSVTVRNSRRDKDIFIDFCSLKHKENDIFKHNVNMEVPEGTGISVKEIAKTESESVWSPSESRELLVSVVRLLHKGVVHHTAAHSILSFTARLTQDHTCAINFLQQGGVAAMVQLRSSSTPCTSALVSLIIRQCIDTDELLRSVYEKTIRQLTSMNQTPLSEYLGIVDNKPKEWFETLRKLTPLAVKNPELYISTMEKCAKMASNGTIQFAGKNLRPGTETNAEMEQIVNLLLREVLLGEWPPENDVPLGHGRMLTRGMMLSLLAELVKTYGGAASLVCGAKEKEQSVIHLLLEKYIDGKDKETMKSLKVLISILAGCNHSPKAQESLVADVKSSLMLIGSSPPASICTRIDELCSLMSMMVDSCPSPAGPGTHRSHPLPNPVMRLFHKKKICNDLVKTITYLQLSQKDAVDTVNQVLKTLESMLRNINSPAALSEASSNGSARSGNNSGIMARGLLRGLLHEDEDEDETATFMEGLREHLESEERERERAAPTRHMEAELEVLRAQVRALEQQPGVARPEEEEEEEEDDEDDDDNNEDDDEQEDGHESVASFNTMDDGANEADAMGEAEEMMEAVMRDEMEHEDARQDGSVGEGPGDDTMMEVNEEGANNEGENGEEEEEEDDDDDNEEDDDEDDYDDNEDDYRFDDDHQEDMDQMYNDIERPGVMLNAVNDFDIFPELFGLGGGGARNAGASARQRHSGAEAHHPLLVRPQHLVNNRPMAAQGAQGQNAQMMPSFRVVLGGAGNNPLTLTRQNAIRRLGTAGRVRAIAPGSQIFDRIFDMQLRDRYGPDGAVILDSNLSREDRVLRTPANVPSALDRLTEGTDYLEPLSVRFVAVLCHAVVTNAAVHAREKAEKEAALEKKDNSKVTSTSNAAENSASAVVRAAETASVVAPPVAEVADVIWGEGRERELVEEGDLDVTQDEEAMDVTEHVAGDENPPNSSAATAASSTGDEREERPMEEETAGELSAEVAVEMEPAAAPGGVTSNSAATEGTAEPAAQPESAPAAANNQVPEEYRAILGDITLPDGVDPAFLAALPEEMRAEVIRDHERQQRAQRANAAVPAVPAAAVPAEDGGAPVAPPAEAAPAVVVPAVEPIDQEFLAALPPELQEEIIQQHERAVREAEEAARRAAAPAVPPPVAPEMDGAAVIASLPPGERAQVLAEMDETELQRLPEEMQAEARRARTHMQNLFEPIHRNVMRIHNLYVRGGGGGGRMFGVRGGTAGRTATSTVGNMAGRTNTGDAKAAQLLDRDSILTLCGLFLMDSRLSVSRLQKVIKIVCSHAGSCDFVVWCLQALLDKATEAVSEDEEFESCCPNWLDSIQVAGVGHNEKTLKIGKNAKKVAVHPLVADGVCRNVMDALIALAKIYPGHFLPAGLRNVEALFVRQEPADVKELPPLNQFWHMLQTPSGKGVFPKEAPADTRPPLEQLRTCALARMIHLFDKAAVRRIAALQDKLMRLLSTVVQTLPNETDKKLGLADESCLPLQEELKTVVDVLTKGNCGPDGHTDGRTLLVEAMRALSPETSEFIYDKLTQAVQEIGLQLQPQVDTLMKELSEVPETGPSDPSRGTYSTASTRNRIRSRLVGDEVVVDAHPSAMVKMTSSSCPELQLPSVTALVETNGAQYALLYALQTVTKVRDTMRQMKEEKRKQLEDEKKKAEEQKKKLEEERKAREEEKAKKAAAEAPAGESTTAEPSSAATTTEAVPGGSTATTGTAATNEDKPSTSKTEEPAVTIDDPSVTLRGIEKPESRLSQRLEGLNDLWTVVSSCLLRLGKAPDQNAVLALQPAAEAFFLVHAVPKSAASDHEHPDTVRMIEFAEKHREVLNQVLRQNALALCPGGPFAILTQFPKLLDFDVKRKYFRKELTKMDGEREYRRADVNVQVRRSQLFSDSFRELFRLRPSDWKKRFYIVFQGEEGQDAGGLLREWFSVITREIFNPNYALFITAPGDMVTYMINKASHINPEHLDYFKFVGRLIAKAIYDNKLLDCYFTRAFYKHILNLPVRYQDIESEDPAFFKSLEFLLNNPINDLGLDLTFSLEVEEFGVRSIRDLKPDGRKIDVTDENKVEYVNLVCQMKMTGSIRKQLDAFLTGFYEVIPRQLISMFNEQELELLISGLPDLDIDDLAANTEYKAYTKTSPQIQWFWRALRSFEQEDRAKFLQFVTGTSKVPLQGFSALEGMNGVQKFSIHQDSRGAHRLPAAHTCFNQLDLPEYESYEMLRDRLLVAIRECTEGFGFA